MRVAFPCLLWLCALMASSLARAEDTWRAPSSCPDGDDAQEQLEALGADPALLKHGYARVLIDRASTGELRARVTLRHGDRSEQRVLYDRSCDSLAEAAVLVISLAFEGERAEPVQPEPERARTPLRLAIAGLARVDSSLPRVSAGLGGTLRLQAGDLISELEGAWYLPRESELDDVRGRFGLTTGSARACYVTGWRVFAPCIALEVGQARGRALNTARIQQARGLWVAALVGASFTLGPYQRFSPIADVELGFPFQRSAFDVEGAGTLFQAHSLLVRVSLRLAFELWVRG